MKTLCIVLATAIVSSALFYGILRANPDLIQPANGGGESSHVAGKVQGAAARGAPVEESSASRGTAVIEYCRTPSELPDRDRGIFSPVENRTYYKVSKVKIIIVDGDRTSAVEATRYLSKGDHRDLIVYEHDSSFEWGKVVNVSQSKYPVLYPWEVGAPYAAATASTPPPGCVEILCPHPRTHRGEAQAGICRDMLGAGLCRNAKGGGVVQPMVIDDNVVTSYVYEVFAAP
jgi:hypothetical protein